MSCIGKKRRRLDPVFPADTEAMIQVSGLAVVALVACVFDGLRIARTLPGVALAAAVEYTAGLILLARRATAARISRVLGGISHDRLTRLREQDRFFVPGLVLAFIKIVRAMGAPGWLCLDDTFIPHERSRKMKGVYWDHDHALGRNVHLSSKAYLELSKRISGCIHSDIQDEDLLMPTQPRIEVVGTP
jgi:hypothetical protein